jgi:hypothetical protein
LLGPEFGLQLAEQPRHVVPARAHRRRVGLARRLVVLLRQLEQRDPIGRR